MDWKKIFLFSGGVVATAGILFFVLKSLPEDVLADADDGKKKRSIEEITEEETCIALQEILNKQEVVKEQLKAITAELLQGTASSMTFETVYEKVAAAPEQDPLDSLGLDMQLFDQMVDKYSSSDKVRELVMKIMGAPSPSAPGSVMARNLSVSNIIDMHKYMAEELTKLTNYFLQLSSKDSYDRKAVATTAQVLIAAKVEQKFGCSAEDIENCVLAHHASLSTNQEFATISMHVQQSMAMISGIPMES
eukprot:gnl/MRDRNA2_/MRDRNA2_44955_c0_seq1.p1 gnl/MRDRNA2_/MRDRNA2_44955_c0~~gnl/MRDRNA2_/MRDRNA2_44955_c0_seq1.p1  ORF type:complete len:249 (+),score=76.40 gnl/MRDRNA2_/MRDRNA2_44955_c0_seq1:51-797(+)